MRHKLRGRNSSRLIAFRHLKRIHAGREFFQFMMLRQNWKIERKDYRCHHQRKANRVMKSSANNITHGGANGAKTQNIAHAIRNE